MMDLYNDEQKKAIISTQKSQLVLSGAGTGKTKTLIGRVAFLLNSGKPIEEILMMTFTNKAAREMRERLEEMQVKTQGFWVGTFHGIASKILRKYGHHLGWSVNFTIMDSSEQLQFFKRVLKANNLKPTESPEELLSAINKVKERGVRSNKVEPYKSFAIPYRLYEAALKREGVMDFAELLLSWLDLLKEHKEVRSLLQKQWTTILVDEFQDTNDLQYHILSLLAENHRSIFAVGDDDQSIYKFRNANPENMRKFQEDFSPELIKLEKNYRSTANILNAANAVIKKNINRLGKTLEPTLGIGGSIDLFLVDDDALEASVTCRILLDKRRNGVEYKDMAILYRTNAQSRMFEKALFSAKIPYQIYGGLRFFERMEVKNALAYLKLAVDDRDNIAFNRAINTPPRGIGATTVSALEEIARDKSCSLQESIQYAPEKVKKKFEEWSELLAQIKNDLPKVSITELIKKIVVDSGLLKEYTDKKEQERVDNLKELVTAVAVFEKVNPGASVMDFLESVVLDGDYAQEQKSPGVQMMTVHTSKGLEFDCVVLPGLEEGLFPHQNSLESEEDIEEERRLMYVAITRAKTSLKIVCTKRRNLFGEYQQMTQSRFLRDLPKEAIRVFK